MRQFRIAGRRIADDEPCYVVAEVGCNHQGDVGTALALIRAAHRAGADAVKFQKRENHTLYSPEMLAQPYAYEQSFGETYGAHRQQLEFAPTTYRDDLLPLADDLGIPLFATAFDETSADELVALKVPAIKLASGALTDKRLIQHVASCGLPTLLSTGGGTEADVDRAVQWFDAEKDAPLGLNLALLHCTASYPTAFHELNLRCILTLRTRYPELVIGWSGHDSGIAMALIAWAFGARIIDKHFTLNRAMKGTDHSFSLEPAGFTKLMRDLRRTEIAVGDGVKIFYESERAPLAKMRRVETETGRWQITGQLRPH